jgi:Integrase zinc binding domain
MIHKPGLLNKSDALSRHPDLKEGMAPKDNLHVLLDTKYFTVWAVCPTVITVLGDITLHKRIKSSQEYDKDVSIAIEAILKNGPRSLVNGLEEWNWEDGIILFIGHVYVLKNDTLWEDIVKRYHDHLAIGHPGRWKTYELVLREFW